ncbi:hypothetical protein F4777DRAFT_600537 [Nemania sp. FL0916]|nr:hypothetical protein F4777DRAFT_600537 [Nemania sp. FL0916]
MASPLPPRRKSSIERLSAHVRRMRSTDQLTREEFLWALRTSAEGEHRISIHRYAVVRGYKVEIGKPLREMDLVDLYDRCNKSVPIYILAAPKDQSLLNLVLHNYIYRRWFRPYRSEIEHGRFLYKSIVAFSFPEKETWLSQSTTAAIVSVNKDICAETEKTRLKFQQMLDTGASFPYYSREAYEKNQFYILQPLFRAMLILVSSWDYKLEDSSTLGTLPVYLVLTGITDGLSAPITFESIAGKIDTDIKTTPGTAKTTLETAVNFVMGLEEREAAAFGLRPDPVESWKLLGYKEKEEPTSRFVDPERYPHWGGLGHECESRLMVLHEERAFRTPRYTDSYSSAQVQGQDNQE